MQLQDLSYALNNRKIKVCDKHGKIDYLVSAEIVSLENVYTVPEYRAENGAYVSENVVWGNDVKTDGNAELKIEECDEFVKISCAARLDRQIRSIKIRFDELPLGTLVSCIDEDKEVTDHGICINYPEGWRTLSWPFVTFRLENGKYMYVWCKDTTVNKKIFFIKKVDGKMRIDVVQEQDGTLLKNDFAIPAIYCGIVDDIDAFYKQVSDYTKEIYGLEDFESSKIVPSWFKDISLVVIMHMEAFTGKIFHTYQSALNDVKKLTERIDGKHILVYMAGWEGRYYYKYGNYTPDERLGGADGLKKCIDGMHALGCKVMLMYGINMVNKNIPALKDIVPECEFITIGGGKFHCGSVNWEGSHHYDFDELAQLNVGNKPWADNLYEQIASNAKEFDSDGAFLDIAACYVNDRRARMFDGVVKFCNRLREIKPDFMVSGEGYYDGLSKAMPLFQSGHTEGKMHYHDRLSARLFERYSREFAHLCLGDPWYGSTGVHEQGVNEDRKAPLCKAIIPTLSLVDGSIENAWDNVCDILQQANEYRRLYCEKTPD